MGHDQTEYAFVMRALVGLAIIVKLLNFDAQGWISKDLKRGDLYALIEVASGARPNGLSHDQAHRLEARGMVRAYGTAIIAPRSKAAWRCASGKRCARPCNSNGNGFPFPRGAMPMRE